MAMDDKAHWVQVAMGGKIPGPLTYGVPERWRDQMQVGLPVLVPVGRRTERGWVVERLGEHDLPADVPPTRIKPVSALGADAPVFDGTQLRFFRWIARYYAADLGQVIATAVPSAIAARVVRGLHPTEEGIAGLTAGLMSGTSLALLREVVSRPGLTKRGLVRRMSEELDTAATTQAMGILIKQGWASWQDRRIGASRAVHTMAELAAPVDAILSAGTRFGARQKAVLRVLSEAGGPVAVDVLAADQGSGCRDALRRLAKAGHVTLSEVEALSPLEQDRHVAPSQPPVLNDDQRAALETLCDESCHGPHLLFGVTGSGKTEVFLGAARAVLERGGQVLVLVPEIGLTPQLVDRFRSRFGDDVAVLHSGLTGAQRLAHWRRIRAGVARVAVGARSALFAPFQTLGLIVVDEEHDDSYKQDEGVCYHARDLAVVLGNLWRCPTVLASATPALESLHNAQSGRYTMLRLPHRATARTVPKVEVVDMRPYAKAAKDKGQPTPLFSSSAIDALRAAFDDGGKAIVLYNRRGWATLVQCTSCGGAYECPNCGVSMTLHRGHRVMACHYCALKVPYTGDCPSCQAPALEELGKGTERVAERLAELFPDIPLARMDADTTATRGSHHTLLDAFRKGTYRMLVGTQIVAKGHDFPDVTCAVVVSADQGLRMPDFRASERTYALLKQLAGRAGRGDAPGRVIVQTWQPDHPVLRTLDDIGQFHQAELKLRQVLRYPPYSRLMLVRLEGTDRGNVGTAASRVARVLRHHLKGPIDVLGPSLAALAKLVGRWRYQIVLRAADVRTAQQALGLIKEVLSGECGRGIRTRIDVDPRHLM